MKNQLAGGKMALAINTYFEDDLVLILKFHDDKTQNSNNREIK